jgi:hypothetical protein
MNDLTKLRAKIETIRILAKQSKQGLDLLMRVYCRTTAQVV